MRTYRDFFLPFFVIISRDIVQTDSTFLSSDDLQPPSVLPLPLLLNPLYVNVSPLATLR